MKIPQSKLKIPQSKMKMPQSKMKMPHGLISRISRIGLFGLCLCLCLSLSSLWATHAWSYMDVMDTGELLDPGQFRAMLEPQLLFHKEDGGEVIARFDSGLGESSNVRALLG